jgi:hypothetical protein
MTLTANNPAQFVPGQLVRFFVDGWHFTRVIECNGRTVTVKHFRKLKRKKTLEISIDCVQAVSEA